MEENVQKIYKRGWFNGRLQERLILALESLLERFASLVILLLISFR